MNGDYIPKYEGVFLARYQFPYGKFSSDIPTDEYLHVNECGYTEAFKTDIPCIRPPRNDFEMFYIASGCVSFDFNDRKFEATQGQLVILKPGDPHNFIHYAEQKTKTYWMHFAGVGAVDLLKELNLWDETVYTVGVNRESENLFMKVFQEIRFDKYKFDKMCSGLLLQILTGFSRLSQDHEHNTYHSNFEQLDPVIEHMYNNLHSTYENSDYAKMCNLSVSHFIALFKKRTGLPPLVFRQNIRMEKAKNLLFTTELPIKEIANMTGYSDPLYFNRIFRQKNGVPPGEFRKMNKTFKE